MAGARCSSARGRRRKHRDVEDVEVDRSAGRKAEKILIEAVLTSDAGRPGAVRLKSVELGVTSLDVPQRNRLLRMTHYRTQPFAIDVRGRGGTAGDVEPVTASVAGV